MPSRGRHLRLLSRVTRHRFISLEYRTFDAAALGTSVLTGGARGQPQQRPLGLKENVIIGKLIPAATGLKRYRGIDIGPSEKVPPSAYTRPATEEQLLAALQEIGGDGDGIDLQSLGLDFGGQPGADTTSSHEAGEAEETPEVDSPLDE